MNNCYFKEIDEEMVSLEQLESELFYKCVETEEKLEGHLSEEERNRLTIDLEKYRKEFEKFQYNK
jgi:hypothetical protein